MPVLAGYPPPARLKDRTMESVKSPSMAMEVLNSPLATARTAAMTSTAAIIRVVRRRWRRWS